jgi:hypothetical protein
MLFCHNNIWSNFLNLNASASFASFLILINLLISMSLGKFFCNFVRLYVVGLFCFIVIYFIGFFITWANFTLMNLFFLSLIYLYLGLHFIYSCLTHFGFGILTHFDVSSRSKSTRETSNNSTCTHCLTKSFVPFFTVKFV